MHSVNKHTTAQAILKDLLQITVVIPGRFIQIDIVCFIFQNRELRTSQQDGEFGHANCVEHRFEVLPDLHNSFRELGTKRTAHAAHANKCRNHS